MKINIFLPNLGLFKVPGHEFRHRPRQKGTVRLFLGKTGRCDSPSRAVSQETRDFSMAQRSHVCPPRTHSFIWIKDSMWSRGTSRSCFSTVERQVPHRLPKQAILACFVCRAALVVPAFLRSNAKCRIAFRNRPYLPVSSVAALVVPAFLRSNAKCRIAFRNRPYLPVSSVARH